MGWGWGAEGGWSHFWFDTFMMKFLPLHGQDVMGLGVNSLMEIIPLSYCSGEE